MWFEPQNYKTSFLLVLSFLVFLVFDSIKKTKNTYNAEKYAGVLNCLAATEFHLINGNFSTFKYTNIHRIFATDCVVHVWQSLEIRIDSQWELGIQICLNYI